MGRLDFVREEEESADPAAAAELDEAVLEGMVEEKWEVCAWEEGGNRERENESSEMKEAGSSSSSKATALDQLATI